MVNSFNDYLDTLAPSSQKTVNSVLTNVVKVISRETVDPAFYDWSSITRDDLTSLSGYLKRHYARHTRNLYKNTLRALLKHYKHRLTRDDLLILQNNSKDGLGELEHLPSRDYIVQLWNTALDDYQIEQPTEQRNVALLALALGSGIRRKDLVNAVITDVGSTEYGRIGVINLPDNHIIPLTGRVWHVVKRWADTLSNMQRVTPDYCMPLFPVIPALYNNGVGEAISGQSVRIILNGFTSRLTRANDGEVWKANHREMKLFFIHEIQRQKVFTRLEQCIMGQAPVEPHYWPMIGEVLAKTTLGGQFSESEKLVLDSSTIKQDN